MLCTNGNVRSRLAKSKLIVLQNGYIQKKNIDP